MSRYNRLPEAQDSYQTGYRYQPPRNVQYPQSTSPQYQQYFGQTPQYQYHVNQQWQQTQTWDQNQSYQTDQHFPQASLNSSLNTSYPSQTSSQPYVQQNEEATPFISASPMKRPEQLTEEILSRRLPAKRRTLDWATILLTIAVWIFLTAACLVLLYFSHKASQTRSAEGSSATGDEIALAIAVSSIPLLLATILNEVLVERCWRRVIHSALGIGAEHLSDVQMGVYLRAANFQWVNIVKRMWRHEFSWRDLRSMASYGLLRWGTAISIASVQLCVTWTKEGTGDDGHDSLYTAKKRAYWLGIPVFIHAVSIFATTTIWLMVPWAMFSGRYDEQGLLERYKPYLQRVSQRGGNGSIAKYEDIARFLDEKKYPEYRLEKKLIKKHQPGYQLWGKLKGISLGLVLMGLAPGAALLYTSLTQHLSEDGMQGMIRNGVYRFGFHLVFLGQNIFYIMALDFVVWNLSLEGFCKGPRTKPNKSLRDLGYSSGIVLLWRALRQRRPYRSLIFMCLFWVQALLVRSLTTLYSLAVVVLRYGTDESRQSFYDPDFWIGYLMISMVLVVPLFLIWMFTEFQAPIGEQDGWRWAKIAQKALQGDGYYGVREGEAAWGNESEIKSFKSIGRTELR
ncbi:hypothetical protein BT63DRAFT_292958 [Microthyrium microscopicum]|uniref:Uncharacterized protein n=1 Tax=Microthyrium microscopicum TaxID=703497 RepID=A0A6A6U5A4_9PEZI|nr:hypothetical protein BT63DRAFT_292958 [Microthyrium microscopicum]